MTRDEALKSLRLADEFIVEGRHVEALAIASELLLGLAEDDSVVEKAVAVQTNCLTALGRWDEVVSAGEYWIKEARPSASVKLLCMVHGRLGYAYIRLGKLRLAERHIRASVHIAIWDLCDSRLALVNHRRLAVLFKNEGLWQQAKHELEIAITLADEEGEAAESGALRKNLAIVLLKAGELSRVPRLLDAAETHLVIAKRETWLLRAAIVRAKYERMIGHIHKALDSLQSILTTIRAGQYSREEAICLEYLGDCYLAQREYREALSKYHDALAIAEATAPKGDLIPELSQRVAEALVYLGDANQAILHCERGLRVARETGDRYEECATHRVLAMAHRAAGNPTKAHRIAMEGIELGRSYEIPYELARTLAWAGETRLQSKGRDDQALGRLQLWEARAVYERIGLMNEVRSLDRILGFEETAEAKEPDSTSTVLTGISNLDRGALRFGIITCSPEVSEAVATIQSVAPSRIPVLISGPSGVGKELLAQALHRMSDRRKMPFIPVNCGSISAALIESELFGHERGAFTGAIATREGLFSAADGGTIFLDEIGELPPSTQATLLRVLESGELRRVGSDEVRSIDVRVVAATNADLDEMVERGQFRQDLFFRLEGVSVRVPPLREREEDIRALFRHFFAESTAALGKKLRLAEDVEALLCAYSWPGNVRELRNEVVRAVTVAEDGAILGREAFLPKLRTKSETALRSARQREDARADERAQILEALRAHGGNKADAARSLGGMKRTTLLYKIERLHIRPEEYQVNE